MTICNECTEYLTPIEIQTYGDKCDRCVLQQPKPPVEIVKLPDGRQVEFLGDAI